MATGTAAGAKPGTQGFSRIQTGLAVISVRYQAVVISDATCPEGARWSRIPLGAGIDVPTTRATAIVIAPSTRTEAACETSRRFSWGITE